MYIFVDLVKSDVLTLVCEIQRYGNDRYYYFYYHHHHHRHHHQNEQNGLDHTSLSRKGRTFNRLYISGWAF